jgi:hypothetical protein
VFCELIGYISSSTLHGACNPLQKTITCGNIHKLHVGFLCQTRHDRPESISCRPTRSLRRHPAACRAHPVMLATPRPPCARLAAQNSSHVPSPPFAGAAAADCALSARRRVLHHDCLLPLVIKQPAAAEARPAAKFSTPSSCRTRTVSGRRLRRVLNANAVLCSSILDVLLK